MQVSVEKPFTPEELVHFGVKGMKWGVRKAPTSSGSSGQVKTGMSTKKKVAIGVGVAAVVAGTVAVGYLLHKNGKLPVSPLSNRHPHDVAKILEKVGDKRPSRFQVSRREYKRYHRLMAKDRAWKARMDSMALEASRNIARAERARPKQPVLHPPGQPAWKTKSAEEAFRRNLSRF